MTLLRYVPAGVHPTLFSDPYGNKRKRPRVRTLLRGYFRFILTDHSH